MIETRKCNWILINRKTKIYYGWSMSVEKPYNGDPKTMEWVEWGKGIPQEKVDAKTGRVKQATYSNKKINYE